MAGYRQRAFTLVELIAVLVLVGVLSAVSFGRFISNDTFRLQKSRDHLVAAFYSAQQLAMHQQDRVQLLTQSNRIDIRKDTNGNGTFESSESVRMDGLSYPFALESGQSMPSVSLNFNRLGHTAAVDINISLNSQSTRVSIGRTGFVQ